MKIKCDECGNPSTNEMTACKGACTQERDNGVTETKIGDVTLISCNCCDECRELCHKSYIEEYYE